MNDLHPVGDYVAVRDFLIKVIENPGLLTGASNAGLGAVPDGNGGLPVGYGFDLISNSTRQVLSWVEGANASLPDDKRIVKTGRRRIMDFVLSPVTQHVQESGRER